MNEPDLVPTVNFKKRFGELQSKGIVKYIFRKRKKATGVFHYYITFNLEPEMTLEDITRANMLIVAHFPGQVYRTSTTTFRLLTKKQKASGEFDRELILG